MRGIPTALLLICLMSCQTSAPPKDGKGFDSIPPTEVDYSVALEFINDYVSFLTERNRKMGFVKWVDQRSDVSEDFKFELNRIMSEAAGEPPGLGFDPIIDSYL